jgi:DNA-binding NarL/FixJ family response regulator
VATTSQEGERFLQRARLAFARGNRAACSRFLDDGLALVRGSGLAVEVGLLVQLAQLTVWEYEPAAMRAAALEALTAARAQGAFLADAELIAGQSLMVSGSEASIAHFAAAADAASATGNLDLELEARASSSGALHAFGRCAEAYDAAEVLRRLAAAEGKKLWERQGAWLCARIDWLSTGDVNRAVPALRERVRSGSIGLHGPQLVADLALALADAGETDDARRVIRDARRAADTRWTAAVAAFYNAEIEWAAGQPARALAAAEEALAGGIPNPQALVARGTCQWARFELDKRQPGPGSHQPAVVPLLAAVLIEDRAFAQLQAGDLEPAAETFGAAAVGWRGKIARNELRALWGQAEITRRRGETKKAAVALRELDSRCAALGDAAIVARVRASLSRIPSRPPRAVAASKLSAREREVLRLVRDGMTTPQIAARLRLSRRTIDTHVRAATAKLHASTRVEAASLASVASDGAAQHAAAQLSLDERVLVRLLGEGQNVTQAAATMGVSRRTATRRLKVIRLRLRLASNAEAAAIAR